MIRIQDAVAHAAADLTGQVESPYLDALVLYSAASGMTKEQIFTVYNQESPAPVRNTLSDYVQRRLEGEPVAYITGLKEFYSLEFFVDRRVLVPRPDTEILVEKAISFCRSKGGAVSVHDCCTGSGCIAIALKMECPSAVVSASDISRDAIEVFKLNSKKILSQQLSGELTCVEADALEGVKGQYDLITANPPYIREETVSEMADRQWKEPFLALDGGADGLDIYRRLVPRAYALLRTGGRLLMEADPELMEPLRFLLVQNGFSESIIYPDLADRPRVIQGDKINGKSDRAVQTQNTTLHGS